MDNCNYTSQNKHWTISHTFNFLYLYITPRIFSSCLLYSWMRLTWMSKRLLGSMLTPVTWKMYCARRCLLAILAESHSACRSSLSANYGRKCMKWKVSNAFIGRHITRGKRPYLNTCWRPVSKSRLVTHCSVFSHLVIILLSSGLQKRSHLLGVMPLVLFWNFFGHIETKSANNSDLSMSLCNWATPFT